MNQEPGSPQTDDEGGRDRPLVWLVMGDKPGDNGQVEVVGEALSARLGWRVLRRRIELLPQWMKGKPPVEASLHHIDRQRSDPLEPPWPDLIVTIGRRPSMVALWIKAQAGGRLPVVRIGKPTGSALIFDLVIASAEVQVAPAPNFLPIGLPLMRVDRAGIEAAASAWTPVFAALPRPIVGILVGGPTGPYRFGPTVTGRLLDLARAVARQGGTAWFSTSRRTPSAVADLLERELPEGTRLFRWRPDATDNPYRALLALADGLIVTGDSISMMVEVARLGRPLKVLPLTSGTFGRLDLARRRLTGALFARAAQPGWRRAARLALKAGLGAQTRDFARFHRMLEERGLASPLDGPFRDPAPAVADDLDRVVERIAGLLDGVSSPPPPAS